LTPTIGFVGSGSVLWAYVRVLDDLAARGAAKAGPIHVRSRQRADDIRRIRPDAWIETDLDQVLAAEVDVIVLITPPQTHFELATAALERDKHVVCEKPLALSRDHGSALFELAADRGVHLIAAPFVHLSPSFRQLWTVIENGELGVVHSARGLYGNAGAPWAGWMHTTGVGPLAEMGIYNIKSLTSVLGPATEVLAFETLSEISRLVDGRPLADPEDDVSHLVMRHDGGAVSSVLASQAIHRYRRPALEFYGSEGTVNMLGDDWDPTAIELWTARRGRWETIDPPDSTWSWADGLRELVLALKDGRKPLASPEQDLHVLEILDAARRSARVSTPVSVESSFEPIGLRVDLTSHAGHDHTRPVDMQ